ncbi:Vacuolar protein sorting-associated protein 20 [Microbotryomycetes sp. JL221]|nr:Vacuolar protein sorting-associated protein 20 [Microbotryomycetes sp. JL221]
MLDRAQDRVGLGQSSSVVKVTAQDRAILDLKLQRDKLKQYRRRIDAVLEREREIAKQALAAGNKQRALMALRQRKYQENLLSQTDSQLETLQKLVSSIEFSLVEKDVLYGLQQGNQVLKQLNAEMDLAKVEQLMSDTAEAVAYQKEVDSLLSSAISTADEEDILAELEELQAEQLALPQVPTTALPERDRHKPVQRDEVEAAKPARQLVPA